MAIFKRKHAGTATAQSSRKQQQQQQQASTSASSGSGSGSDNDDDDDSDVVVTSIPAKQAPPAAKKSGNASSSKQSSSTAKKQQSTSSSREPSVKARSSLEGASAGTGSKKRRLEEPSPPAKKRSRKDDVAHQLQQENEYIGGSSSSNNSSKKQKIPDKKSPAKSGKADQQPSKKRPKNRYYEPPEDIEDEDRSRRTQEQSSKLKKKGRDSVETAGRKEKEREEVLDDVRRKKSSTSTGPSKPSKVQAKRLSETGPTATSKKRRRESTSSSGSSEVQIKPAAASNSMANEDEESSDSDIVAAAVISSKKASSSSKATQPPVKKKTTSTSTASPAKAAPNAAKPAKPSAPPTKQYEEYHGSDSEDDVEIIPSIASATKAKAQAGTSYTPAVAPAPIKVGASKTSTGEGRRSSLAKKHQSPPLLQPTVVIPARKVSAKQTSVTSVDKSAKASSSARPRPFTTSNSRAEASPAASTSRPSSTKRKAAPAQAESISSNTSAAAESQDDDDDEDNVVVAVPTTKTKSPEKVKKPRASLPQPERSERRESKGKTVPTPVRKVAKPAPKHAAVSSEEEVDELEDDSDDDGMVVATVPTSSKKSSARKLVSAPSRPSSSSKSKPKADKNGYVPAFQDTIPGLSVNEDLYPSSDEDRLQADSDRGNTSNSRSKSNKGKQPAEEEQEDYRPAANTVPTKPSRRPSLRKSDASAASSSSKPVKRASLPEARFSVEVISRRPSIRESDNDRKVSTSTSKPEKQKAAPAPAPAPAPEPESDSDDEPAVMKATQAKAKSKSVLNKARKKSAVSTPVQSRPASPSRSPSPPPPPATTSKSSKVTKSTKAKAPAPVVQEIDSSATEDGPEEEDPYALPPSLIFSRLSEVAEDAQHKEEKAPVRADSDGSDDEMLFSPDKPLSPQRKKTQSSTIRIGSSPRASSSKPTVSPQVGGSAKLKGSSSKTKKTTLAAPLQDIDDEREDLPTADIPTRSPSVEASRSPPAEPSEPLTIIPDTSLIDLHAGPPQEAPSDAQEQSEAENLQPASISPSVTSSKQEKVTPEAIVSDDDLEADIRKQRKPSRSKPSAARKTTRPRPAQPSIAVARQASSPSTSPEPVRSAAALPDIEADDEAVTSVFQTETTVIETAGDDSDASAGIFSEAEEEQPGSAAVVEKIVVTRAERVSKDKEGTIGLTQVNTVEIVQRDEEERSDATGAIADVSSGEMEVDMDPLPSQSQSLPLHPFQFTETVAIHSALLNLPDTQQAMESDPDTFGVEEAAVAQREVSVQPESNAQAGKEGGLPSEISRSSAILNLQAGLEEPLARLNNQQDMQEQSPSEASLNQAETLPSSNTSGYIADLNASRTPRTVKVAPKVEKPATVSEAEPHASRAEQQGIMSIHEDVSLNDGQLEEVVQPTQTMLGSNASISAAPEVRADEADQATRLGPEESRSTPTAEGLGRSSINASPALRRTPEVRQIDTEVEHDEAGPSTDAASSSFHPAELTYEGDDHLENILVPDIAVAEVNESFSGEMIHPSQSKSPAPAQSKAQRSRKSMPGAAKSIDDNIPVPRQPNENGDEDDFDLPPELQSGLTAAQGGDRSTSQDSNSEATSRDAKKPSSRQRTKEWEKLGTPMKLEDESSMSNGRAKRDTKKARKSSTAFQSAGKKSQRPVRSLSPGKPAPLGFSRGISRGIRKSLAETYSDDDDEDVVTVAKSSTLFGSSKRKSEEPSTSFSSALRPPHLAIDTESLGNQSEKRESLPPFGYHDDSYMDNDNFDYSQSSFLPQDAAYCQDGTSEAGPSRLPYLSIPTESTQTMSNSNKPSLQSNKNSRVVSDRDDDSITVAASTSARYHNDEDFAGTRDGDTNLASPQPARAVSKRTFGGANKHSKRASPRRESSAPRHNEQASTSFKPRRSRLSLHILSEYEVIEPDDVVDDENDVTVYILEEHEEFEFEMEVDDKDDSPRLQPPLDKIRRAVANSQKMDIDPPSIAGLRNSSSGNQSLIGEETTPSARKPNGTSKVGIYSVPTAGRRPRKAPATYREDSIVPKTSVEPSSGKASEGEEDAEGTSNPGLSEEERFSKAKLDQWMSTFTDFSSTTIAEREIAKLFTSQMTFPLIHDKNSNATETTSPEDFRANLDPHLMLLAWQLQSTSVHMLGRDKFREHMLDEMIDSPERLQQYLQNLWDTVFPRVHSRKGAEAAEDAEPVDYECIPQRYFGFYNYVYGVMHDFQTSDYPFETVIATWSCILASYSTVGDDLLEYYTDVLDREEPVTEELWQATLNFVHAVTFADKDRTQITGFVADAQEWPKVIEEYVQWVEDGRQPLPTKDDLGDGTEQQELVPVEEHDPQQQTTVQEASDDETEPLLPAAASTAQSSDSALQHERTTPRPESQDAAAEKAIEEATREAMAQAEAVTSSQFSNAEVPQAMKPSHEAQTERADAQTSDADHIAVNHVEPSETSDTMRLQRTCLGMPSMIKSPATPNKAEQPAASEVEGAAASNTLTSDKSGEPSTEVITQEPVLGWQPIDVDNALAEDTSVASPIAQQAVQASNETQASFEAPAEAENSAPQVPEAVVEGATDVVREETVTVEANLEIAPIEEDLPMTSQAEPIEATVVIEEVASTTMIEPTDNSGGEAEEQADPAVTETVSITQSSILQEKGEQTATTSDTELQKQEGEKGASQMDIAAANADLPAAQLDYPAQEGAVDADGEADKEV